MQFLLPMLAILGGLVLLVGGGELLVRGAARLASALGLSPLVIGLTVVAFGTSAPELAVSLRASLGGNADIAVGNVVGSNICNVLLILGASALIAPLVVSSQLIRLEVPLMIAASLAMLLMALGGVISRVEGGLLFAALVVYVVWTVRKSRQESAAVQAEFQQEIRPPEKSSPAAIAWQLALIAGGLALLGLGANWLVGGATTIAKMLGMSDLLIGLTIVAVGTSLPEVATSLMASIRGERDIAVGNVVGSNLFNIFCVLGLSAAISPAGIPVPAEALRFDIPVMFAASLVCLPIFFTGRRIDRWEGGVLLAYFVAYVAYLILDANDSALTKSYTVMMLGFAVPLTVLTLVVTVYQQWRSERA